VRVSTKSHGRGFLLILILRLGGGGEGIKKVCSLFPLLCLNRSEIIYCKSAILCLSSSKILTPHPPLRLASVSSPPTKAGVHTHSPVGEGDEGSIFWKDERDRIALLQ
jgi:hypothetical protein